MPLLHAYRVFCSLSTSKLGRLGSGIRKNSASGTGILANSATVLEVLSLNLLLGFSIAVLVAQPSSACPAENKAPQPADFERLAEIFAPPGTPIIKGKAWVAVDTGTCQFLL